jgi:hypothetical protein
MKEMERNDNLDEQNSEGQKVAEEGSGNSEQPGPRRDSPQTPNQ